MEKVWALNSKVVNLENQLFEAETQLQKVNDMKRNY